MSTIDFSIAGEAKFISMRRWQADSAWRPLAHSHAFCEIVVVLRGLERAVVRGKAYTCEPGQVMFYPPGWQHEERQTGTLPLDFLCLDFDWPRWPGHLPIKIHDRQGRIQELARWLIAEEQGSHVSRSGYMDLGVRMIAAELLRLVECPPDDVLARIYDYVRVQVARPITLDDLAACAQINKFHLSRMFRTRTGLTPMEYVRQTRLDFAYRLLLETALPLREIAPRVGFANEYHLSRLIKERYGRGARELRRVYWSESEPAE